MDKKTSSNATPGSVLITIEEYERMKTLIDAQGKKIAEDRKEAVKAAVAELSERIESLLGTDTHARIEQMFSCSKIKDAIDALKFGDICAMKANINRIVEKLDAIETHVVTCKAKADIASDRLSGVIGCYEHASEILRDVRHEVKRSFWSRLLRFGF